MFDYVHVYDNEFCSEFLAVRVFVFRCGMFVCF